MEDQGPVPFPRDVLQGHPGPTLRPSLDSPEKHRHYFHDEAGGVSAVFLGSTQFIKGGFLSGEDLGLGPGELGS